MIPRAGSISHGCFRSLAGFAAVVMVHCLGAAFWQGVPAVSAQQLSIRHYDVSDGLAHSHVTAMHQDRKGYLWLATWEGLSRFDGYGFSNFGTRDGLGDPIINAITEDNYGNLWVAVNGGGISPVWSMIHSHQPCREMDPSPVSGRDSSVSGLAIRRRQIGSIRCFLIPGTISGVQPTRDFIAADPDKTETSNSKRSSPNRSK